MKITVITALNDAIYQEFAKTAIETWQWQPEILWQDDEKPTMWNRWREYNRERHPETRFENTWLRFSHKAEQQCHHLLANPTDCDYLVWLDADMVQLKEIPTDVLQTLLPTDTAVTFLERNQQHPDTAWVAYNMRHEKTLEFAQHFQAAYLGERLWGLQEQHDAFVWNHVRLRLDTPSKRLTKHTVNRGEAVINSLLEPWFRHYKGRRKALIGENVTDFQAIELYNQRSKQGERR